LKNLRAKHAEKLEQVKMWRRTTLIPKRVQNQALRRKNDALTRALATIKELRQQLEGNALFIELQI
jgi:hypothetical protein